ncbi:MAG: CrcB family protein [Gloeomargarita sp. SKYBB_i_bin120]|nr:CrcB family protein [Gloeomargarita sp. SKYB120]MDW8178702.1 CrcB family protein [Gloeomargarita sp. SKYBB_i_bin120]
MAGHPFHPLTSPVWLPLWIALGAIPGALSCHYLLTWCSRRWGDTFPWGTVVVNLSGSVLLGSCAAALRSEPPWVAALVAMGFISSYTTFSTYVLEMSLLYRRKHYGRLLVYGLGSSLAGFLGVELGLALSGGFSHR